MRTWEELFEVFGSQFSIGDIASVYSLVERNKNMAGDILCGMQGATSGCSGSADNLKPENGNSLGLNRMIAGSSALLSDNIFQKESGGVKHSRELKSKKGSASMGTVSGVIGKDYIAKTKPSTNVSVQREKPLKINSDDFPVSEVWSETNPPSMTARNGIIHADVEEFVFKMLGVGFKLDVTVIREVLGLCGYDVQMSVDKLLDLSASRLEKSDDIVRMAVENSTENHSDQDFFSLREEMQSLDSFKSGEASSTDSLKREKARCDVEKEVLQSLFSAPDRSDPAPKKRCSVRDRRRSRAFGDPVVKPLDDEIREHKPPAAEKVVTSKEAEDDENSYEAQQKAAKEYRTTMRSYYKAAAEAFANGDHSKAYWLIEKGQFFNQKAREADEKSFQKMFEIRDDEVVSIDLCTFEPKEALRFLRFHLTKLSGIPSIKYLKVKIDDDGEDTKKQEARKRLIVKQLEKESIKWIDAGNGQTILIQVDVINPERLSFFEKHKARGA